VYINCHLLFQTLKKKIIILTVVEFRWLSQDNYKNKEIILYRELYFQSVELNLIEMQNNEFVIVIIIIIILWVMTRSVCHILMVS